VGWAGKILGATLGAMAGGPVGAVLGAIVGHQFDRGAAETGAIPPPSVQQAFFETTFAVMGRIAKADGRVSETEIRAARAVMHHMRLSATQVQEAIRLFTEGKEPDYPVFEAVERLRQMTPRRRDLHRAFMEIQMQAMLAGDSMNAASREVLWDVAQALRISRVELAQIEALIRLHTARAESRRSGGATRTDLGQAYRVLGVAPEAGEKEVKTAYRRLMNQHHPDKLRARGMPESMIPVAEEKTREIRAAYDAIRQSRGIR
jgi:DnaJ like chaperone protein